MKEHEIQTIVSELDSLSMPDLLSVSRAVLVATDLETLDRAVMRSVSKEEERVEQEYARQRSEPRYRFDPIPMGGEC